MLDLTDRGNDKIYPSSLLLSIFMYIFQKNTFYYLLKSGTMFAEKLFFFQCKTNSQNRLILLQLKGITVWQTHNYATQYFAVLLAPNHIF